MENSSYPKIERDLRQSEKWAKYLEWLGWRSFVTTSGVSIEILFSKIGSFVKIQRPRALSKEDLGEIERICKENKALFIKIEPTPVQNVEYFTDLGYIKSYSPLSPPSTIYINLTESEEHLFSRLTKNTKSSVKKSAARTEFLQNPSENDLKKFYQIADETAQRQKFTLQGFEDLKKKVEVFDEESWLAFSYDSHNNLMGGKFFLASGNAVWYLHAASTIEGRKADAGDKMMWDSFLYFKSLGYEIMDLDGIDDPRFPLFTKNWGGFSFFKEKFGGHTVRFPLSYIKYLHPFFKFLNRLKRLPL